MVSVAKGSFAKSTGAAPVTQSISTGFSMSGSPSVLILWTTKQTAGGLANQGFFSYGFSDGTNHRSLATASDDAAATSNTCKLQRNIRVLTILTDGTSGSAAADEATVAFTATGFDLTWNPNTANAYLIHYMAVSGLDNVEVGSFTCNIVTGNQTITQASAFTPAFVMLLPVAGTTADNATSAAHAPFHLGAFTASGKDWAIASDAEDGRLTMDTWKWQRQDSVVNALVPGSGAVDSRATFVSMNSNGFTINWADAPASADIIYYLSIKGGQWAVDEFTKGAGTPPFDRAIATVGFTPKAYMLLSIEDSSLNPAAAAAHAGIMVGGTDGTSEGSAGFTDEDNIADSDTYNRYNTDKVIQTHLATDGSIREDADHKTFDANGFTITWTTGASATNYFFYIAVGDAPAGAVSRSRGHVF